MSQLEQVPKQIAEDTERVLSESLYWFPVRHHSPAVARHLQAAMEERRPKVLFIEGPAETNDLIPFVTEGDTRPPVALYSSYRDDDNVLGLAGVASPSEDIPARFASYYPLTPYSPEFIAMKTAKKLKTVVVFMDLPHYAMLKPADEAEFDPQAERHGTEELITASEFYQGLAHSAGFRSWDETWDSLFEFGDYGSDTERFRRELATFCAAARATTPQERMENDGTLERERFMRQTIRDTLKARKLKPEDAMVVCGGFHLFMDHADDQPPPEPPEGTVYTSLVPYSFFRISDASGYAAGNRAPKFYQACWDHRKQGDFAPLLAEHVVNILKRARREGQAVSSADAIAITQHAGMLANLRGRRAPVLEDIEDAIFTCCCKGRPDEEGRHLRKAIDVVNIGNSVGKVTKKLGRLPLLNDFYEQVDRLDLKDALGAEQTQTVTLDKRETEDDERSVFLHRLNFLQIPFVTRLDSNKGATPLEGTTIFRERWRLTWTPNVEPALIEENLYGDSIEQAVLSRLHEALAADLQHAGKTCTRLRNAIEMDLPDILTEIETAATAAVALDSQFVSLATALSELGLIHRQASLRNLRRDRIEVLIVQAYQRACFALPSVASVPEEDQEEVIDALRTVAEWVVKDDTGQIDRQLLVQYVSNASKASTVPFLQGAFLGMLAELRAIPQDDVSAQIAAFAKQPPDRMIIAGDFLSGVLAVSRTSILLGSRSLIEAIDDLLRAAPWDPFLMMLPRLRGAFERLHERQVDTIAGEVALHYGLAEAEELTALSSSPGATAQFARIDAEVARLMNDWDL